MGLLQMKVGKITVTTAEASGGKNVDCGFVPEFVMAFNEDVATTEDGVLIRFGGMAAAQALALQSVLNDNGSDATSIVNETSNGLSDYDAGSTSAASSELTGTSTPTGTAVAGSAGSLYTTELAVDDIIQIGVETRRVIAIASDTALTVDFAFTVTASDTSTTKFAAGALVTRSGFKGFTLPSNFLTTAGDVIHFMALGTQFVA
jgi:hypothetical protein